MHLSFECLWVYSFAIFSLWILFSILVELMLLGLISLLLAQCARCISEICVNSSLFTSRFYICSEEDYATNEHILLENSLLSPNETVISRRGLSVLPHQCGEVTEHLLPSLLSCLGKQKQRKKMLKKLKLLISGSRAFCFIRGTWTTSPLLIRSWDHSCSL